jgi:hypothetical protein
VSRTLSSISLPGLIFAVHLRSCTGLGQKFTGVIKPETHPLHEMVIVDRGFIIIPGKVLLNPAAYRTGNSGKLFYQVRRVMHGRKKKVNIAAHPLLI